MNINFICKSIINSTYLNTPDGIHCANVLAHGNTKLKTEKKMNVRTVKYKQKKKIVPHIAFRIVVISSFGPSFTKTKVF